MVSPKKIITIAILLCSIRTFGYNFTFSNVTERTLVISYKLEGLSQEYYQIIPPDQSVSYYFPNVHCFGGSILWAEYKSKDAFGRDLPFHGGIDLVDPVSGEILKGEPQNLFKAQLANKYAFIPMQIKVVDNETFQLTANAAVELAQGIDTLSCETISAIEKFMSPAPGTGEGMGTMTNIFSTIKSKVMGDNKQDELSEEDFTIIERTTEHPAPPTDMPPTISELVERGTLTPELTIANPAPTQLDMDKSINMPISASTIPAAKEKGKKCRFGLGKIAKGGATLAGVTLCRDLHFVIVDTGEVGVPIPTKEGAVVSRVKKPILIAEINQGG